MSICKEQFISALRDGVSAEFDFIPKDEDTIEYSFSKNFEKINKHLKENLFLLSK